MHRTATAPSQPVESTWRRHVLGLAGVACMAIAVYFYVRPPDVASLEFIQASCIKSGLVLLATWLAYPQLDRLPSWFFLPLVGVFLAIAVRPRISLLLIRFSLFLLPLFLLIWILRPKQRRRR